MKINHAFDSPKTDDGTSSVGANEWDAEHLISIGQRDQTGSFTIASTDAGKEVRATGTTPQTVTLPAASSLPDDWFCWALNDNTGAGDQCLVEIDCTGSDTIDGVGTIPTYFGDYRIIRKKGSTSFETVLLAGGYVEFLTTSTFKVPSQFSWLFALVYGAGGGGGSGRRGATSTERSGGQGGSGGSCGAMEFRPIHFSSPGSSITCTIGAGGTGAPARTTDDTDGAAGNNGSLSSFGTLLYGYGGTGGPGGTNASANRTLSPGLVKTADSTAGGIASSTATATGNAGGGGAHGAGNASGPGSAGNALQAGAGGGGGGRVSSANSASAGSAGGGAVTSTSGGSGSAASAANSGSAGSTSSTTTLGAAGLGGGGSGGHSSGVPGAGGKGGPAAGGGGGGASLNGNNSGAGGDGGDGMVRIWYGK